MAVACLGRWRRSLLRFSRRELRIIPLFPGRNSKNRSNMKTLALAAAFGVVAQAAIVADEVTQLNGWSPKPLVSRALDLGCGVSYRRPRIIEWDDRSRDPCSSRKCTLAILQLGAKSTCACGSSSFSRLTYLSIPLRRPDAQALHLRRIPVQDCGNGPGSALDERWPRSVSLLSRF